MTEDFFQPTLPQRDPIEWEDNNGAVIKELTGEDPVDVLGPDWENDYDTHDCHRSAEDGCEVCQTTISKLAGLNRAI